MGFFDIEEQSFRGQLNISGLSVGTMHKRGCEVCPLNMQSGCAHPHMAPAGDKRAKVYMLGEFPTRLDDKKNAHFTGHPGEILRMRIPPSWDGRMRWNNVVRTATPQERAPSMVEVECCRPSIVQDIERTRPVAIFGFGPVVLHWAIGERRIESWTGRRIPIRVGKHACWFFPMYDLKAVAESRRFEPRNAKQHGSDMEFKFARDMRAALRSIDTLPEPIIHTREDATRGIEFVTGREPGDLKKVLRFIDRCSEAKVVGLDYETQGLRPYKKGHKVLTAALALHDRAFAFPFYHRSAGWSPEDLKKLVKAWTRFLIKSKCRKVSHQLAFEQEWSAFTFGIETIDVNTWEDSMSQAYLLDERPKTHGLDTLCMQHYGLAIKSLFSFDKNNMDGEKLEAVLEYNGVDAKYHRSLYLLQRPALKAEGLRDVYEHQVQRVNAGTMTTLKGFPVSDRVVEANYKKYRTELEGIDKELLALPIIRKYNAVKKDHKFRPSNTNDVTEVLRKFAGIVLEKTKNKKRRDKSETGNYSTTEEALLKVDHPFAKIIIRWRKVAKLLGTYVIPVRREDTIMPDGKVHATTLHRDGKLHPIYATAKTRTWRTASEDPNAQNWPKRGPAKIIRKQVEVDDDHIIVAIDYAGIQARNVAMESKDKGLIKHYWARYDIHGDWLDRLLKRVPDWRPTSNIGKNLDPDTLRKEQRSAVKNRFVFPSFFGAVAKSISGPKYLGIDERHALSLHEEFFDEFPDVKRWHEEVKASFQQNGYVQGLSGFKRRAPIEVNQLINAPIQADETLIVCGAWIRLCQLGDDRYIPNLMVHDDLTFIWRKKDLDKHLAKVVPIMLEQVHEWERVVPMEVEVSVGQNWCDLKEIAVFETKRNGGYHQVKGKKFGGDRWDYDINLAEPRKTGWTQT